MATISSPVRPSTAPHRPVSRTRSMVPGNIPADAPNYHPHLRTTSPLATTYSSPPPVSAVNGSNDRLPLRPPGSSHSSGTSLYSQTAPDPVGAMDQVRGNFDRMFVGVDNNSSNFRSMHQPNSPATHQSRNFLAADMSPRDLTYNNSQSLVDVLHQYAVPQQQALSSSLFLPSNQQQRPPAYHLLSNSKQPTSVDSTASQSHRALAQTLSDPFAAPPRLSATAVGVNGAGGHSKLSRQLSLNPYASQSYTDTSQFFRHSPLPLHSPRVPENTTTSFFGASSSAGAIGSHSRDSFGDYLSGDGGSGDVASLFFAPSLPQQQQRQVPQHQPQQPSEFPTQQQTSGRASAALTPSSNYRMLLNDPSRVDLFDRLCCLFPEEKVLYAMNCYPQEKHVEKLCGYILKIFPADG